MACTRYSVRSFSTGLRLMSSGLGDMGSGAGKSGGSGGSIRDAGGAFGRLEAGREEEYFYKLQRAQLKALKGEIARELEHTEDTMSRHKKRMADIEKVEKELEDKKK